MAHLLRPSCHWPPAGGSPTRRWLPGAGRIAEPGEATPLEALQAKLLSRAMRAFPQAHYRIPLLDALGAATTSAEATGFPLLTLPELFREHAIAAMLQAEYRFKGRF